MLAALTAGISVSAQPYRVWQHDSRAYHGYRIRQANRAKFSVKAGWGSNPYLIGERFDEGSVIGSLSFDVVPYRRDMNSIYKDYHGDILSTGSFSGEFNWNCSRIVNMSGIFAMCPMWSASYDGVTGARAGTDFGMAIIMMPNFRLMYCNTPSVRAYSSLGMGFGLYPGFRESPAAHAEIEFAPFGIEIGRKWFGFAELGVGTIYQGIRLGAGYQFGRNRRVIR